MHRTHYHQHHHWYHRFRLRECGADDLRYCYTAVLDFVVRVHWLVNQRGKIWVVDRERC
nr:MAG TPA: ABC sugar transporter [Caudoviricetes sp.]